MRHCEDCIFHGINMERRAICRRLLAKWWLDKYDRDKRLDNILPYCDQQREAPACRGEYVYVGRCGQEGIWYRPKRFPLWGFWRTGT